MRVFVKRANIASHGIFNMIDWFAKNWILLALTLICGAYFAFYVMLARERRAQPVNARPRLEKDC